LPFLDNASAEQRPHIPAPMTAIFSDKAVSLL
jgi:hypothetical protein